MRRILNISWLLMVVFCCHLGLMAQTETQNQTKQLKEVTSTEGRDFFVAWLPNGGADPRSADLKLQLLASSRNDNSITVEFANGATQEYTIEAGQTTVITVDPNSVFWDVSNNEEEMLLNKGIRVYSTVDETFTLYSINQNGIAGTYSFDGAHILPVEALGTEYLVQTAKADEIATEFVIMSTMPGQTNVNMTLKVNSRQGTTERSVTMNGSKQIFIVRSKAPDPEDPNDFIDLSGSTICADQPIAVWSGNQSASVPNQDAMSKDHAYDQLLPLNKWGKKFLIPLPGMHTQYNEIHVTGLLENTTVTVTNRRETKTYPLSVADDSIFVVKAPLGGNQDNNTVYIDADKPVQVYLFSSAGAANPYDDENEDRRLQGDPSMTIIPPLEYMTDTTIFSTYDGGDGGLSHEMRLWARTADVGGIQLDGNSIASSFSAVAFAPGYSQAKIGLTHGTHTITAPNKCFSGYVYGMNDGQAYLYPVGYDFTPQQDSLFLLDDDQIYAPRPSEWYEHGISDTESGWHLDRMLLDDGTYQLDSTFVCDKEELTFPIKTYELWEKVIWEIEGSIQGTGYFPPEEQLSSEVVRPELTHQFELLPIEQNNEPYEDFEVRAIVIRKPILCDIPEDKWERDTFATIIRVLRQYDDTTWRAICWGDTVQFFNDTVWVVDPTTLTEPPVLDQDYFMQTTIFNDTLHDLANGYVQYPLGVTTLTKSYVSTGGCDSLSTLKLYVCPKYYTRLDTVVCELEMNRMNFGEFFERFSSTNSWPKVDTVLFDTLRTTECKTGPDWREFRPHCRNFNGCDSVMELHLKVMRVTTNRYTINQCKSLMPDDRIIQWREKGSDRLIKEFLADTLEYDKIYTFREYVKYTECTDCPPKGCDSVRNILSLQLVTDEGQSHTVHVCQGQTVTYRNQTNSQAYKTFSATGDQGRVGSYVFDLLVNVMGQDDDGKMVVMCSFNDEVTFIVDTVFLDQMTYDTLCYDPLATDQTYSWYKHPKFSDIPITKPGKFTYYDTLKTYDCGCDSVCVLQLSVGRAYETYDRGTICDNESYLWQDTLFYGKNFTGEKPAGKSRLITTSIDTRRDLLSQYGCDSIFYLHLVLHPTYMADRKDTAICGNEPYNFYGTWYNTPENRWEPNQTYPLTINDQSRFGCDSLVLHNVTVYPYYPDQWEDNDTVCQVLVGTTYYEWPGADHQHWNEQHLQTINQVGSYQLVDELQTIHGCDSTVHRTLVVMPTYDLQFERTMSSEDTLHWEGRIYAGQRATFENPQGLPVIRCNGIDTVADLLQTHTIGTHSCDSLRTLIIKIGQVFRDTTYDAACVNCGTYYWNITSPITGEVTTITIDDLPAPYEERFYYDSLVTAMGFDSIYVLRLTGYPTYNKDASDEVCQGDTYHWSGHMGQENGVEHRLFIYGLPVTEIPTDLAGVIQVVDSMLTDTIFTNPVTGQVKPMHCDSVWTLTLTIHPTYNRYNIALIDDISMSSNDTLSHFTQPRTLFVGYHYDFAAAGTSREELEQQYERVVYLPEHIEEYHLDSVVNSTTHGCDSTHYVRLHVCEVQFVQLYDSIGDNDTTWFFGGEVGTTGRGAHTLPLVTGHRFHYYDDGTPVDYSQATGRTVREYFFIDTLFTASGCDSIVHNRVRVFPTYRFDFDTVICSNARWDWRKYTYLNNNRSGYVYDSVNYQVGTHTFDSVYVLDLAVVPSGYWQFDTTLCMNDTLYWHYQKVYYQPGGLRYVEAIYKDENSLCGDIYHMNLTFVPYFGSTMVEHDTICQDVEYHWISPGEIKEHTEALCDGRGNRLTYIPTDVPGEFTYYDSLNTYECGCDSVYTLKLFVKPTYHFYDTTYTLCSDDTLQWHGREYYYRGETTVYDTVFDQSTVYACDSNYYVRIHFDLSYDVTDTVSLCSDDAHFTWEDIVFDDTLAASRLWDEPRHYTYARFYQTAISGCDSILRLDLTISPSNDSVWTDTLCRGETYYFFDQQLTEAGDYVSVQPNRFGCMNHYYITLVQMPLPKYELKVDPVCVDEDGMANTYLLHFTYDGDIPPTSYSIRYDSAALAIGFEDMQDIPIADGELTLRLPVPYFASRGEYPRPGYYEAVIAFQNGVCLSDTLMTYPFQMEMRYPSWITTQHWNDAIFIMDSTLNGGYDFSAFQWYRNDSILYGETRPYLYDPQYLHSGAQYSVALTRSDDQVTVRTCPITPDLSGYYDNSPKQTYVSVVPTVVAKEDAVVYILSTATGHYKLLNPQGQLVSQGAYIPDARNTYPVQLPAVSGVYVFHLTDDATAGKGGDLSRTVKVIVQ